MSNSYYTASGTPGTGAFGASAAVRSEFLLIQGAFDKLPSLGAGLANTAVVVNPGGTGFSNTTGALALAGALNFTGGGNLTLTLASDSTLTLPGGVTDTLVGRTTTDNLTNKTLTAPIFAYSGTNVGGIDSTGFFFNASGNLVFNVGALAGNAVGLFQNPATLSGAGVLSLNLIGSSYAGQAYPLVVNYSAASPNSHAATFFLAQDNTGARCIVWSDGDIVNSNNSYTGISDARIKQDVIPASSQWNDVKALAGSAKKYRLISDVERNAGAPPQLGAIAQDWLSISPGLVSLDTYKDGTTLYSIKYSIAYMKGFIAVGEALVRIEALEAEIADLKKAA